MLKKGSVFELSSNDEIFSSFIKSKRENDENNSYLSNQKEKNEYSLKEEDVMKVSLSPRKSPKKVLKREKTGYATTKSPKLNHKTSTNSPLSIKTVSALLKNNNIPKKEEYKTKKFSRDFDEDQENKINLDRTCSKEKIEMITSSKQPRTSANKQNSFNLDKVEMLSNLNINNFVETYSNGILKITPTKSSKKESNTTYDEKKNELDENIEEEFKDDGDKSIKFITKIKKENNSGEPKNQPTQLETKKEFSSPPPKFMPAPSITSPPIDGKKTSTQLRGTVLRLISAPPKMLIHWIVTKATR